MCRNVGPWLKRTGSNKKLRKRAELGMLHGKLSQRRSECNEKKRGQVEWCIQILRERRAATRHRYNLGLRYAPAPIRPTLAPRPLLSLSVSCSTDFRSSLVVSSPISECGDQPSPASCILIPPCSDRYACSCFPYLCPLSPRSERGVFYPPN